MKSRINLLYIIFLIFFSCQKNDEKFPFEKGDIIDFESFSKSEIYFSNSKYIILLIDYADYTVTEHSNYRLIVCNKKMEFLGSSKDLSKPICLKGDTLTCNIGRDLIEIDRSNLPNDLIIRIDSYGEDYRSYGNQKIGSLKQILYDKLTNKTNIEIKGSCKNCIFKNDSVLYVSSNNIHLDNYKPSVYIISYDSTCSTNNFIKFYITGTEDIFLEYKKQIWNSILMRTE